MTDLTNSYRRISRIYMTYLWQWRATWRAAKTPYSQPRQWNNAQAVPKEYRICLGIEPIMWLGTHFLSRTQPKGWWKVVWVSITYSIKVNRACLRSLMVHRVRNYWTITIAQKRVLVEQAILIPTKVVLETHQPILALLWILLLGMWVQILILV